MRKLMVFLMILAGLLGARCVQGPTVSSPEAYIPDHAVTLSADNFDSLVTVAGRTAMIDFFSPTCPACRAMDTAVDNLAERFGGKALVGRVNVLEEDSLTDAFSVGPIPLFVFVKSGIEYERIKGMVPGDSLAAALQRGLSGGTAKSARAKADAPAAEAATPRVSQSRGEEIIVQQRGWR